MAKTLYSQVFENLAKQLGSQYHDLLDAERKQQKTEDGEVKDYCRFDCEVRRNVGLSGLSRCRFSVKIAGTNLPVNREDISKTDYLIRFSNLSVSWVSSDRTIFFKADSAEVIRAEEEILDL